jgi:nucleoid-associated protein YgaU
VATVPVTAATGLATTERIVTIVPPAPVVGQALQYTVQPGESLASIALNFYGSMQPDVINSILAANRALLSPYRNRPQAGMVLTLPARAAGRNLRDPITRANLDDAAGLYLVRSGDTLSSIALHFFGHARYWRRIYEANRGTIHNANAINSGQWIIIPQ